MWEVHKIAGTIKVLFAIFQGLTAIIWRRNSSSLAIAQETGTFPGPRADVIAYKPV